MSTLNKKAELVTLEILKQCREKMVKDFLENDPEIYIPSYKYENSPVQFKLARERYFITWLGSHWQFFIKTLECFSLEEIASIEPIFAQFFLNLLSQWSIIKSNDCVQLNLGIKLIEDMKIALNNFIQAGDNADVMRNKLVLALEKNRTVFDRKLKQLTEES